MANIIKLLAIPVISLSLVFAFSDCASAQGTASGTINVDEKKSKSPAVDNKVDLPAPNVDTSKPYRFGSGKRDPFVPFGGNVAPETTLPKGAKTSAAPAVAPKGNTPAGSPQVAKEQVSELPIKVTATMISGSNAYAILTAAEGSSSSFMVKPGDKVGAYTVQSIYTDRVVLLWDGKSYTVPVKAAVPQSKTASKPGKADVKSDSLPVPKVEEEQKAPAPAPQPAEPKADESKGSSESK